MRFDFNLDYKIDEFKDIMKCFRHAPMMFYPFMFSSPAFAAEQGDVAPGLLDVESELLTGFIKEVQDSGFDIFQ